MIIKNTRRKGVSKPMTKTFVKVEKSTEKMVLERAKAL
jgi:hypothetical protein